MDLLNAVAFPKIHRGPTPPSPDWTFVGIGSGRIARSVACDGTLWTVGFTYKNSVSNIYTSTAPQTSWSAGANIGASQSIYALLYDGTRWLAGTSGSLIYYGSDPTSSWSSVDSDISGGMRGLTFSGSKWATVGGGTAQKCSTSTSPESTWTENTSGYDASVAGFYGIATDGSVWVRVGNSGKLHTASNPSSTWTSRTSGFGSDAIYSISYDGTYWVSAGANGKLFTATDPTSTWTSRTSGFGSYAIYGVANNGGTKWVAVGSGGKLFTASDPTSTWTEENSGFGTNAIYGIAHNNSRWVAVGTGGISTWLDGM